MKISVKKTGGFAGVEQTIASVDTRAQQGAAAQRAEQAVRGIKFFDLPEHLPTKEVGFDLQTTAVTVHDDDGRQHTVRFVDDGSPKSQQLKKLVEEVAGGA